MSHWTCLVFLMSCLAFMAIAYESCGPTTYCPDGSMCCSAETCCPRSMICCHRYFCCAVQQQPYLVPHQPNIELPPRKIYNFYYAQLPKQPASGPVVLNLTRIGSSVDIRK
uniref:Granulins domain-containing protein n=1 Tax=Rhodnius prolixus TaxID=13249 RepID=A0A4P6D9P9_RHOPR